jgi:hypothetical protein
MRALQITNLQENLSKSVLLFFLKKPKKAIFAALLHGTVTFPWARPYVPIWRAFSVALFWICFWED